MPKALVTTCEHQACPTVWEVENDQDNVLVQGYRVADASILGDINLSNDEVVVVIPKTLLRSSTNVI